MSDEKSNEAVLAVQLGLRQIVDHLHPHDSGPSADIEALNRASAEGRVDEVHQIFWRYMHGRRPDQETGYVKTSWFNAALGQASENGRLPVVSYLLDRGLELKPTHMERVVRTRSTDLRQIFLGLSVDRSYELRAAMRIR